MIIPQRSKKIRTIFFACFYIIVSTLKAQVNETIPHSSIESLNVTYSITDPDMVDTLNLAVSKSSITLKSSGTVSVLHFKILNPSNQSVIYQADYSVNGSAVIGSGGIVLFRKEAATCYITSAVAMPLGVYQYQLSTEDSQGSISEVYTEFK